MAVYVGASDGMLHAFGASDGAELFAYVPRTLVAALGESSDPAFRPRPYVDGSPGQGDALIGARWRTVLASGMGMGARGVFALDISDPMAFVQGMGALWEFTEKDDPAIGYVQGAPQIAKLNTAARGRPPAYRYFVIVPSAVNGVAAGGNGALFLLALDKPAAQRWRAGVNYFKIATSGADAQQANGLSPPGLVTAADGSASLAYAGDLQGRLWRFDLSAMTAQRLFTARDAGGRAQPIAGAPRAVFAPGGGYLVLFGTGKLTEPADLLPASSTPQSLYGILDRLEVPAVAVRSRAQLAERTLSGGDGYSTMGDPIDYFASSAKRGWFIDLANGGVDGERSAGTPSVIGSAIVFDTVLPGADLCAPAAHREYVLDALSGMALGADGTVRPDAVTAKLVPAASPLPPLLLETGVATAARSATGMATATRTFTLIQAGPNGGPAASTSIKVSFPAMRLGWREVANWQELHDAANR
jgi:type IV pilus assembly protein PilY1